MNGYFEFLKKLVSKCEALGRDPNSVCLVAVTKGKTAAEIAPLVEAGCVDLGESRVQEALVKMEGFPEHLRWHFIGHLQKNKVRKVVGRFMCIHSVDSFDLAEKISEVSSKMGLSTEIFLEVNISGEGTKEGFSPDDLRTYFPKMMSLKGIRVIGLMTMAPLVGTEKVVRGVFRELAVLSRELNLPMLSMGMSGDWELALEEGATHLRVGRSLFLDVPSRR